MTDSLKTSEKVEGPYSVGLVEPELEEVLYKGFGNISFTNPIDGLRYGQDPVDYLIGKTIQEGVDSKIDLKDFKGTQYDLNFGSRTLIARKMEQTLSDGRNVFVLGIELNNLDTVLTRQIDNHQEVEIKWDPKNPHGYWRVVDNGKHTHDPEGKNSVEYQYIFIDSTNMSGQAADFRVMFLTKEEYDNCVIPPKEVRRSGNIYPTNRKVYENIPTNISTQPSKKKGLLSLFR